MLSGCALRAISLMKRLAASRNSCISFLISSSLAPRLKRFAQRLFGGAQVALGFRGVAVLELLRHRPEQRRDVKQIRIAVGVLERGLGLLEAQIDIGWGVEQFRRDRKPGQRRVHLFWRMVRIEDEVAALLDERAGERVVEASLRQRQFDRRALAGLA